MADVVPPDVRSRMMAGIRNKNTRPELAIRKALHRKGLRYRLHAKDVPGKPDILFPRYRAAVLVHGCFWHGHDCALFRLPENRREFWKAKIERNQERDRVVLDRLAAAGWRTLTIWECSIRGRSAIGLEETVLRAADWIRDGVFCEFRFNPATDSDLKPAGIPI
jgi:DNA mismatch endonuclease (patch repair protein)